MRKEKGWEKNSEAEDKAWLVSKRILKLQISSSRTWLITPTIYFSALVLLVALVMRVTRSKRERERGREEESEIKALEQDKCFNYFSLCLRR